MRVNFRQKKVVAVYQVLLTCKKNSTSGNNVEVFGTSFEKASWHNFSYAFGFKVVDSV